LAWAVRGGEGFWQFASIKTIARPMRLKLLICGTIRPLRLRKPNAPALSRRWAVLPVQ